MENTEQKINEYYYDAMDCLSAGDTKTAMDLLQKAIAFDRHSVQTILGIAEVYKYKGDEEKAYSWIGKGFEEIKRQFPKWPKRMEWGDLDNRAYLRILAHKADYFCDIGKTEEGIELYKLLLKLNPNDNQGIRYLIAGIYKGITGEEVNKMFDEGNRNQNWNKLEDMVEEQNKIYKFWGHKGRTK